MLIGCPGVLWLINEGDGEQPKRNKGLIAGHIKSNQLLREYAKDPGVS